MFNRRMLVAAFLTGVGLVSAVQAQVKLVRRYPEGKRTVVTTSRIDQKINLGGMEIPTLVDMVATEEFTHAAPAPDGTRRVVVKDAGMVFKLKVLNMDIADYDSAKPADAKSSDAMVQAILEGLKSLHGKTRTYVYDKDGKLKDIEGVDAILAQVPNAARAEIESGFNKSILETEAKKDLDRIPERELKKGDKWQVSEVNFLGQGQTITFDMFYEYQGTIEKDGKTLDKISLYAGGLKFAQGDAPNAQLKVVNSDLKIESSTGTLYFDRQKGDIVELTHNIRVTGPATYSFNNMEIPGKMDLTMDTQIAVK